MKRFALSFIAVFIAAISFSQTFFDLGLKAGVNNSKVTTQLDGFTSESITKMHWGAFGRMGWNRLYIQPEVYFSAKGGNLNSDIKTTIMKFNYYSVDVPVLAGLKIVNGEKINLRIMAGPVFSISTSSKISGDVLFTRDYYEDRYIGYQYGIGADILMFTIDARMDNGFNDLYSHPSLSTKNSTFMVSVGLKLF